MALGQIVPNCESGGEGGKKKAIDGFKQTLQFEIYPDFEED